MSTIFTKIINREIPAKIFHETDDVIVIADHRPRQPVHLLIIHKKEYPSFRETPSDILVELCDIAKEVAEKLGIPNHYQVHVNNGYGQEIDHIHLHFMSNRGIDRLKFLNDGD